MVWGLGEKGTHTPNAIDVIHTRIPNTAKWPGATNRGCSTSFNNMHTVKWSAGGSNTAVGIRHSIMLLIVLKVLERRQKSLSLVQISQNNVDLKVWPIAVQFRMLSAEVFML